MSIKPLEFILPTTVGAFACYGIDHIFPSQDRTFLVLAGAVHLCALANVRKALTQIKPYITSYLNEKQYTLFQHCVGVALNILLPLFYRVVGQRIGYPVPSYLHLVACFSLSSQIFWTINASLDAIQTPSSSDMKKKGA